MSKSMPTWITLISLGGVWRVSVIKGSKEHKLRLTGWWREE